ncbi:rod shape-determining protein [Leptotrichia sp. oral taxon 847]|uniref:rod shape-determining protein n=1 Tax=Leptotrichia sp. oral taxon 847 TaxID=1785996 RepID=UPI0007683FDC|nr:rod shape-determining protein [Leptotrichia sp. oral taxon 847]AMD94959.1 rod shape-determining protein MreB [Leptotrichia sp. oral taxon 847]
MKFLDFFKTSISPKSMRDVAIDLGTANTVVYVKGEGIRIDEPTYVAINIKTEDVEFIGSKAKEIIGRTAKHTEIIRPLKNGVISNYEVTEKMIEEFLSKLKKDKFNHARVIICVPSGVTQVERRAVVEVVKDAGAKDVYLIEEPVAAAIGVGIDLFEPKGHLIVDIGGGTTEIAFIVSGGSALSRSIKVAGDHLNDDIAEFVKDEHNLLIGEKTAEELKINTISQDDPDKEYEIRGRELGVGLPKSMRIKASEIEKAIERHIDMIIDEIRMTIEEIEPEVAADIYETGIFLSGGGATIRLLKERIEEELKLKVTVGDDAIHAVINGIAKVLDDFNEYKNIIISPVVEY